jgi:hypothetical protein
MRSSAKHVSAYIERAYLPGHRPSKDDEENYIYAVIRELQDFGFIADVDVFDPTWIEVAYTWSWPQSKWRAWALHTLQKHGIFQAAASAAIWTVERFILIGFVVS